MSGLIVLGYFSAVSCLLMSCIMKKGNNTLREEYHNNRTTAIRRETISKVLNEMKAGPWFFFLLGIGLAIASSSALLFL